MDYSKLSDLEINGYVLHRLNQGQSTRQQQLSVASGVVDYCNNPADAWPIIEANRIGLKFLHYANDHWCATADNFSYMQENPLRAAMIVFLMMQEGG